MTNDPKAANTPQADAPGAAKPGDKPSDKPNDKEILAGLAEIIEEVAGVDPDDVTKDKSFVDDLDIDSLSMVEIAVQAEDRFGVKIPDEELANLKTVGDAVSYIAKAPVPAPKSAR